MGLDSIVNISITTATSTPTQAGFGTPLIACYHSRTVNVVDTYSSTTEMLSAGFTANDPAVKAATKIFSQNPRPEQIKIGKRTLAYTQVVNLTPLSTTQGTVYHMTVYTFSDGVSWNVSYTVGAGATIKAIVEALKPLIQGLTTDFTVSEDDTKLVITASAGKLFNLSNLPIPSLMTVADVTTNPGIATDLSAIEAVDSDWYGLILDYGGAATITAAAAWLETRKKVYLANTSDGGCVNPSSTTDIMYTLKAAAYARTSALLSAYELIPYSDAAWLARGLTATPGSNNWAYVTLTGITVDTLLTAEQNAVTAKNGNWYCTIGGLNCTYDGEVAYGEYLDVVHFTDWLRARMQERIFGAMKALSDSQKKLPYTEAGLDVVRSLIMAQLREGQRNGGISTDYEPVINMPALADISAADKSARRLTGITFSAILAGAINNLTVTGVLSLTV